MPVLVPETPVTGRGFVAAELRPHGVIDQLGKVMRDFDIGAQTEEYIAGFAGRVLLAPNPAIAEISWAVRTRRSWPLARPSAPRFCANSRQASD